LNDAFSQQPTERIPICLISDTQSPMLPEKILLRPYRNKEARDSLFADIVRLNPVCLFMLGDLTAAGSVSRYWAPLDLLLNSLGTVNTSVFAMPGNHEYMFTAKKGREQFRLRFPEAWLHGYMVHSDSIAVVMLNSNIDKIGAGEAGKQLNWYASSMDQLDSDPGIRAIMVCTHYSPYSNSKITGESEQIRNLFVPKFEGSKKAVLFLSGHSHNLEHFSGTPGKHYLVIGGGGGIKQPLKTEAEGGRPDLLSYAAKPLYFYLTAARKGDNLEVKARGFGKDFRFFDTDIGTFKIR
jgi:hypothetical protein